MESPRTPPPVEENEGSGSPPEVEARAWLKAHAHDPELAGASLPGDHYRSSTGETAEHEQSAWLTAGRGWSRGERTRSSEGHRGVLSYSHLKRELAPDLDHRALVGRGPRSTKELDGRVRLERAMRKLRGDQARLLRMRYFEQMTNEDIGKELGKDESAIRRKVQVAAQDLYVAIAETWALPYDPAEEHLGIHAREGRPARDREGERQAAERVFVATQTGDEDE